MAACQQTTHVSPDASAARQEKLWRIDRARLIECGERYISFVEWVEIRDRLVMGDKYPEENAEVK